MASSYTASSVQTPTKQTYSLLLRTEASSTPQALHNLRRKLSEIQEQGASEMESPITGKRMKFLDAESDDFKSHYQASVSLKDRVDVLGEEIRSAEKRCQEQILAIRKDMAPLQKHFSVICRGEIITAVRILLGLSSSSNHSTASFRRQTDQNFANYLYLVRQKLPNITETEFENMLRILSPSIENSYSHARNSAAHRFTIAEARRSTEGNFHPQLSKWVDLLAASGEDEEAYISDVAFENVFSFSNQAVERYEELIALMGAVKSAPDEAKLEYAELAHEINEFRIKKKMMEQHTEDQTLMKEAGIVFTDSD